MKGWQWFRRQQSSFQVPNVLQRGPELLRKISLTLGGLWSIKDLVEHFTSEKTLTSVSWTGYITLVKTSPEHFGSSFAFLTQRQRPGFLLVCSGFKWALQTKSRIGLGPKFPSNPLSAVHWEIHPQQMGFCSDLVLMLSGEWELFELQRLKWKPKSNQNPKWSCSWADVFRPRPSKSLYKKTLTTLEKQIVGTLCTSRKENYKNGEKTFWCCQTMLIY